MPTLSASAIQQRAEDLYQLLDPCELCPRLCRAHRRHGKTGFCKVGDTAVISSVLPHFGEEPPISGTRGSGTVFLTSCNAACIFCQNYQISHLRQGTPITTEKLAHLFLQLQQRGCHNINWVTPDPHLPFLVHALSLAVAEGLQIPIVYNTNGYCRPEILNLLEGVVDIYLPDMKYSQDVWAEDFSNLPNYYAINTAAVAEMYRQVGPLVVNDAGVAVRGLLVRHLVLPEGIAGSARIFRTLTAIDPYIPVSIMAQYHPCYRAVGHSLLGRRLKRSEYLKALEEFEAAGLFTAYTQDISELEREDLFFPDFDAGENQIFKAQQKHD